MVVYKRFYIKNLFRQYVPLSVAVMLTLAVSEVVASTGKEAGAPGKISHTEAIRPTPDPVSAARMQQVYEAVKTPFKYGLVLAPERNDYKMDCPVVFRHGRDWYMTYLVYNGKEGKDGRGYETWLAESSDLLTWRSLGKILSFKDTGWDTNQRGGFMSLIDRRWGGGYHVRKVGGQYWMTYIGGNTPGYEQGMLKVGVAHTAGHIGEAHEWETFDRPVLSPEDPANGWWESLTQYKSSVMWDKQLILGAPFVMFYNAGGVNPVSNVKGERIGIALSHDMKNWTRYAGNPVVNHEGGITGDADVQQMGDLFVLFYYSAFRPGVPYKAYNNFCCSYDLIHWTDWKGEKLIYPSESYDDLFAHKPCVISHNGIVYHFYCAVNQANQRGIALATSKPVGRSAVRFPEPESTQFRKELSLNGAWSSRLDGDSTWTAVFVPHNWDQYYGYRRLKHGNLHGTAWYKRTFQTPADLEGNRCFLYFEGVGSYATVFVNGRQIGAHQGGLTTFTLDVTGALHENGWNELMVKVEQPAMISDLPWICGGCSGEMGFSEGSQPLGIFRPVTLVVTNEVRIQPFGVFLWNEPGSIRPDGAETQVETTLKNYGKIIRSIQVVSKLVDENGIMAARSVNDLEIDPGEEDTIQQVLTMEKAPERWSPEKPVLYTLITLLKEDGKVIDELRTPYGFRTVSWPQTRNDGDHRLYINDKPVFLNGIGEYEHQLGISHSFSDKQIESRVQQIKAAGFNAFRDAHQPHNLLYKDLFDKNGILFWSQFSAHVWFDTPAFRSNFKALLKEWVIERRNSPSLILWGLQNESCLPEDFARECTDLIRNLDPTASTQRLVTTCNGGEGTDWNIMQNWSGTYGGDPEAYGEELSRQWLNGEYGAWRTLDLHTEGGFVQNGAYSENRCCQLLEQKIRLAGHVRDSVCGHFLWLFNSHENPGRLQNEEASREIDRIGPVNYKGLFTAWGEPLDAYYLYRANYAPEETSPMVYIVSHTWPDRWTAPGRKNGLVVYSNCDSVELFNDVNGCSLGMRRQSGRGGHFQWDSVMISYNVLFAVGYAGGKPVAKDCILLHQLPQAPHLNLLYKTVGQDDQLSLKPVSLKGRKGYWYVYRVNCGGPDYKDVYGQHWMADRVLAGQEQDSWGSGSWAGDFNGLHPVLASQRMTNDPIAGTKDWPLFQTFRYGTNKLAFHFPVTPGDYLVELYFTEPWYGTGGGLNCDNWRNFDVAVNGKTVIKALDIWRDAGHDGALKRTCLVHVDGDRLDVSFPYVASGQALISAIAIASKNPLLKPAKPAGGLIRQFVERPFSLTQTPGMPRRTILETLMNRSSETTVRYWLNTGDQLFSNRSGRFCKIPSILMGAEWIQPAFSYETKVVVFKLGQPAVVYLAAPRGGMVPAGFVSTSLTVETNLNETYRLCRKAFAADSIVRLTLTGPYVIMVVPDLKPAPETDIRPDIRFEAETARLTGPVRNDSLFQHKACAVVDSLGTMSVEWKVNPGLAGIYNLRFRYRNVTEKALTLRLQVIAADDRLLKDGPITFPPASDKWKVVSTTTEAFINAGVYRIRLSSDDAAGLWLDAMDVQ